MNQDSTLGIVVIGRNEGQRLVRCLRALDGHIDRVVYADSGSTDASPGAARECGATVVTLETGPFTAARGRQAGLEELLRRRPDCRYVQFIDGDCILDPAWLGLGRAHLESNPRVAAVCGRLREERVAESFYSRMIDLDWDLPAGKIDAVGGISMMRINAIQQVGGWRTDLIAGEEPELGYRLQGAGWELVRLAEMMATHDIAIDHFGQYWKRAVRTGHAYAEIAWLFGQTLGRQRRVHTIKNIVYGLVLPVAALVLAPFFWRVSLMLILLHFLLAGRIAMTRLRRGGGLATALAYGEILTLCKTAMAWGALRFYWSRLRGRRTKLIEYKQAAALKQTSLPRA